MGKGIVQPNKKQAERIRSRVLTRAAVVKAMAPELRSRAFAVSGIEDARLLDEIRELCASVPEGENWRTARRKIEDKLAGEVAHARTRAELVLRTNCTQARAQAKWEEQQKDKDVMPYLMYQTLGDNRVRPSHNALNGKILKIDDPFWKKHYPPWDFGCRCTVIQLDEETAKELCKSKEAQMMSTESKQDFNARFKNEKHNDYAFDPTVKYDVTETMDDNRLRSMWEITKKQTVWNKDADGNYVEENAAEYLWRTGPQAADDEELRQLAFEDGKEHAIIRDAETGKRIVRYDGTEDGVEDTNGIYSNRKNARKVITTHIHPNGSPILSPQDVIMSLSNSSVRETAISSRGGSRITAKPHAKLSRERLIKLLEEFQEMLDNNKMSKDEWVAWLNTHKEYFDFEDWRI